MMEDVVSEGLPRPPVWYDLDADRQEVQNQDAVRRLRALGEALYVLGFSRSLNLGFDVRLSTE
jgi:hypothetical protein